MPQARHASDVELYGVTPIALFRPLALKAVREQMIQNKWVRRSINKAIGRIRHIFRWGVENELVNPKVLTKLEAVAPLLAGRSDAKDTPPRTGVNDEHIEAVRGDVSELVRDLIDLQRLIGARSGEILGPTAAAIDRSGQVWSANLGDHKTVHHGHTRILAIGPKAHQSHEIGFRRSSVMMAVLPNRRPMLQISNPTQQQLHRLQLSSRFRGPDLTLIRRGSFFACI